MAKPSSATFGGTGSGPTSGVSLSTLSGGTFGVASFGSTIASPEPTTLLLLGNGFLLVGWTIRHRLRSAAWDLGRLYS